MNGPSGSYLTATSPEDIIATETAAQTLTASSQAVMDNLQRARTEQVNKESAARLAKQKADKAAADAKASQDAAVAALTDSKRKFDEQREQVTRLAAERDEAQAKLDAAKLELVGMAKRPGPPCPASGDRWDPGSPAGDAAGGGRTGMALGSRRCRMVPSANVPGDPIAVINQVLGISATSTQVTAGMGRSFLQQLGILQARRHRHHQRRPGPSVADSARLRSAGLRVRDPARACRRSGVPYSWGGGNAAGPE